MSSIFRLTETGTWEPVALPHEQPLDGAALDVAGVQLVRFGRGADGGVALLVRTGVPVRANGETVTGGMRVLEHQDEVCIAGRRFYLSAESTPVVALFRLEGGGRAPTCPVCRGPVKDGQQAVRCPGCGRWHHQIDETEGQKKKHCWTYAATCPCGHPTALGGGPVWKPEPEEARA